MLEATGLHFGLIGLFCLAFLFLPVSRGSVLLRLVDIPFEHAARYHVWLGHLTMLIFSLHGLFYVIAWTMKGELIKEVSPAQILLPFVYRAAYAYVLVDEANMMLIGFASYLTGKISELPIFLELLVFQLVC